MQDVNPLLKSNLKPPMDPLQEIARNTRTMKVQLGWIILLLLLPFISALLTLLIGWTAINTLGSVYGG